MYCFCTYFDQQYLPQGLALYRSLEQHCPGFHLWIVCMDSASLQVLSGLNLRHTTLIPLERLESHDPELLMAKGTRSRIEYYFTCTPSLPLHILAQHSEVPLITYLDADLFFFADPRPLFDELGSRSIAIIAHRFKDDLNHLETYGKYNVGWLSFRRDDRAKTCLRWWRQKCLEWCYSRVEDGRFADQKYLDDWPDRFEGVVVLKHKGANLAPWNLTNCTLKRGREQLLVDKDPLIFYHFHALRLIYPWLYDPQLEYYSVKPFPLLRRGIYQPYLRTLAEGVRFRDRQRLSPPQVKSNCGLTGDLAGPSAFSGRRIVKNLKWARHIGRGLWKRKYFCLVRGHVL